MNQIFFMELFRPVEIKRLRNEHGIQLIEVAAWCGLPAALIRQIEDEEVPVLDTDLERIASALRRILFERAKHRDFNAS